MTKANQAQLSDAQDMGSKFMQNMGLSQPGSPAAMPVAAPSPSPSISPRAPESVAS